MLRAQKKPSQKQGTPFANLEREQLIRRIKEGLRPGGR